MILWPYQDVNPQDRYFEAENLLAVRGILPGDPESLDFQPWRTVTRHELAVAVTRAYHDVNSSGGPTFSDLAATPEAPADWKTLYEALKEAGWKASDGLISSDRRLSEASPILNRQDLALHLWDAIKGVPEHAPSCPTTYLQPGSDCDGDGIADLDDTVCPSTATITVSPIG